MADVFPTLSSKPDGESWSEGASIDPTLRSESENGIVATRPRFTSVARQWQIRYRNLSQTDKATLEAFEKTAAYGAGVFSWLNPTNATTYQVRFGAVLDFQIEPENPMLWHLDMTLIEANPNSGVS